MGGMERPRDARQALTPAVEQTLGALDVDKADSAAVALARRTASAIDNGEGRLSTLGPLLLATLRELGATPAARKALTAGQAGGSSAAPKSALQALRDARRGA